MARIARTEAARTDLANIWRYIAGDSRGAAERHLARLSTQFEFLAANPEAGRSRPDLMADLRSWPVGSYVVFYRPTSTGILIIRVIHASRDVGDVTWSP